MRTLLFLMGTVGWATLAAGALAADPGAPLLPSDSRIRVLLYDEADVYTVTTKYGYQTNVIFGEGEEVETISVGDRSLWQIIPSGRRLFVRPMEENVTTNMTVITNKRSYQFDLKSVGEDSSGNIYVARFIYPGDLPEIRREVFLEPPAPPPAAAVAPPPAAEPAPPPAAPASLNYDYTYSGPDRHAPAEVYDDGASTFIRYRTLPSPLPSLHVAEAAGERNVTYHIKDGMLVVNEVAAKFLLKGKDSTITVYNETQSAK